MSSGQIAISGPSTVSYCGMFSLVGHFTSPKGDAAFYWTAYREESTLRRVENPVADALLGKRYILTVLLQPFDIDLRDENFYGSSSVFRNFTSYCRITESF